MSDVPLCIVSSAMLPCAAAVVLTPCEEGRNACAGTLVCFRRDGRLLMVVQHDRHWQLVPMSGAPLGLLHTPEGMLNTC